MNYLSYPWIVSSLYKYDLKYKIESTKTWPIFQFQYKIWLISCIKIFVILIYVVSALGMTLFLFV